MEWLNFKGRRETQEMRKTWVYQMLMIDGNSPAYHGYIEELDEWGAKGWELCAAYAGNSPTKMIFWLKRERDF